MAQGVTNAGFGGDTCGLAKARVYKMTGVDPLHTHHKMAQRVTNAGFGGDTCGLAKARVYKMTPKNRATAVATAGVPCCHYAALSFSLGLLLPLASFCMGPCEAPAGFI